MAKKHKSNTERALFLSLISTVLCVAMLAGLTFAWFTMNVESDNNVITTAPFDAQIFWSEHSDAPDTSTAAAASGSGWNLFEGSQPFTNVNYLPGMETVRYIAFYNNCSYNVKFDVSLKNIGEPNALENALLVYVKDDNVSADVATSAMTEKGTLSALKAAAAGNLTQISSSVVAPTDTTVPAYGKKVIAVGVRLPESYETNDSTLEATFILKVIATQYNVEHETLPVTMTGTATSDLIITSTGVIESATVPAAAANAVFDNMATANADNELTLNLNVTKTGETETASGTTVALNIDMSAVMKTTANSVTTTTTSNIETLQDYVTITYDLGAGKTVIGVNHSGEPMEALASADADVSAANAAVGGYYYNSTTGILTIKTKSFSPFTVNYMIPVTGITLNEDSATLSTNGTLQLNATVAPDNASPKTVTWTSSNDAVATVSSSGLVTAVSGGSATVTAAAGGMSATCAISVIPANAIFKLIPDANPDNCEYLTVSQLNAETGLLVKKYKAGNYTLELLKDASIDLAGSGYSNFWSYKFGLGDGAENVVIDLKGHTLTFKDSSYAYASPYLMAYDCKGLSIKNGTLKSDLLGGDWNLFASYCWEKVTMQDVTLIHVINNRNS